MFACRGPGGPSANAFESLAAGTVAWIPLLVLVCGCTPKPRAPVLSDEPVYQNDAEGFRFLAPPGWSQHFKANLPPGTLGKERMLVQYKRLAEGLVASLEVTVCDRQAAADLEGMLSGPAFGIKRWPQQGPPETVEASGVSAQRFLFSVPQEKEQLVKEVVVFPRGERVYFFTGLYYASDTAAREQLRSAVESTLWRQ